MAGCQLPFKPLVAPGGSSPAWLNPMLVMAMCGTRSKSVTSPIIDTLSVAPADPKRVGIFFGAGVNGNVIVAPDPNPDIVGWPITSGTTASDTRFTIFDYGPLVCLEWFAFFIGPDTIGVFEVYRLPGG